MEKVLFGFIVIGAIGHSGGDCSENSEQILLTRSHPH